MSSIQWSSQDPRTPQAGFTPYSADQSSAIESSYQAGNPTHVLSLSNGMTFTIRFNEMKQYNQSGGSRPVRRGNGGGAATGFGSSLSFAPTPSAASSAPSLGGGANNTTAITKALREQVAAVLVTGGSTSGGSDRVGLSGAVMFIANQDITSMDKVCTNVVNNLSSFKHALSGKSLFGGGDTVDSKFKAAGVPTQEILHVLSVVIELFAIRGLALGNDSYGDDTSDLSGHKAGSPVPAYNANAVSESIYRRKYLSLLGLRNLVIHGPTIFSQLHNRLFSGNPAEYGNNDGPNLMRYVTGNVVDLDTVVLDCNRQIKLAASGTAPGTFFSSAEAKSIAAAAASPLIEVFIDQLKLTKDVAAKRNLTPLPSPGGPIPIATHNTDRGKYPLWGYSNVGVLTYHANVPHLPDVAGALLKAPFHLAKAFLLLLDRTNMIERGAIRTDDAAIDGFITAIRELFDEALSDSCFNKKWHQIESYLDKIDSCDSIAILLGKLQQDNQKIFSASLFDNDDSQRSRERKELEALVVGKAVRGRDPTTGTVRLICADDIAKYIKDTM